MIVDLFTKKRQCKHDLKCHKNSCLSQSFTDHFVTFCHRILKMSQNVTEFQASKFCHRMSPCHRESHLCHGLLKRFGTAEVLGIVSSAMSFKMEVKKDMGSSASAMADCCRRVLHR